MAGLIYLNEERIKGFDFARFQSQSGFPWLGVEQFLRPEAFAELSEQFPSLTLFERHDSKAREYGQRPHNRQYLAYEQSVFRDTRSETSQPGVVKHGDLPQCWQRFIEELNGKVYQDFLTRAFGSRHFAVRYAWHVAHRDDEVSPHRDHEAKLGTHLFYFNTEQTWRREWGGEFLALERLQKPVEAPEFSDFAKSTAAETLGNTTVLFANTKLAWHGVERLRCPEGSFRRLFQTVIEARPEPKLRDLPRRALGRVRRGLRDSWSALRS